MLISRISDLYYLSAERNKPTFSNFLNENEVSVCIDALEDFGFDNFSFFGGYNNSQRKILGFSAHDKDFPISIIEFSYRKQDSVNHRQLLGAILSTGLKRSVIGDIICLEGKSYVFILSNQADYVMGQVQRVARVGVKSRLVKLSDFTYSPVFKISDYTVSSMRLDNIVAAITGLSREKTRGLILSGSVYKNQLENRNLSQSVDAGDVLSIRKYGKYTMQESGGLTKKGRIKIKIKQYT